MLNRKRSPGGGGKWVQNKGETRVRHSVCVFMYWMKISDLKNK